MASPSRDAGRCYLWCGAGCWGDQRSTAWWGDERQIGGPSLVSALETASALQCASRMCADCQAARSARRSAELLAGQDPERL
jgi:hypothetical protein